LAIEPPFLLRAHDKLCKKIRRASKVRFLFRNSPDKKLRAMPRIRKSDINTSANIGFEAKLWLADDKLRSNMDAAEHKHVVLGLIFLNVQRHLV
jgi:hypothetical protein